MDELIKTWLKIAHAKKVIVNIQRELAIARFKSYNPDKIEQCLSQLKFWRKFIRCLATVLVIGIIMELKTKTEQLEYKLKVAQKFLAAYRLNTYGANLEPIFRKALIKATLIRIKKTRKELKDAYRMESLIHKTER